MLKKQQRPIQIRIGCGKSDPANRNRPDSGYPLAVMAQTGRTGNGSGMFTASILSIYSPSRLRVNLAAFGLTTCTVHAVGHRYICFSNRRFVPADIPGRTSWVSFKELFQTQHNKTGQISRYVSYISFCTL